MKFKGEVKAFYINGNYETGDVTSIKGIIIEETYNTITIAKISEKVLLFKRHIIKIEDVVTKEENHFKDLFSK